MNADGTALNLDSARRLVDHLLARRRRLLRGRGTGEGLLMTPDERRACRNRRRSEQQARQDRRPHRRHRHTRRAEVGPSRRGAGCGCRAAAAHLLPRRPPPSSITTG
ncbi:MAG: hypothetical protein R2856_38990 [Caldilineaceae bacterium]